MNYEKLSTAYLDAVKEMLTIQPGPLMPRWPRWNSYMRLQEGQYTVFCGPTGAGKTQFLANLSSQLIETEVQSFTMSVETGRHDYIRRCMEAISGKRLTEYEPVPKPVLVAWHKQYGHLFAKDHMNVSVHESRIPVKQLLSEIDYQVKNYGCKVAIIDNLNYLMQITRAQDAIFEMDNITHTIIEYVKQNPIHIIMVMHPRKTEEDGRIESMYDIKGSSTAVQEAHNVILFNKPRKKDINEGRAHHTDRELYFPKLRKRGWMAGHRLMFHCEAGVSYTLPGAPPRNGVPGHQRGGTPLLGGGTGGTPARTVGGLSGGVVGLPPAPGGNDEGADHPGEVLQDLPEGSATVESRQVGSGFPENAR